MPDKARLNDFLMAIAVVALGAALSWLLVGGLPLVGIDDAAITRSYAENIANGAGYVYNIGGERVEGSTALLWVIILTVAYVITPTPEKIIIGLCMIAAFIAVHAALRLTRLIAEHLQSSGQLAVALVAILLLAMPGYFLWSVWTMMELALWSALLLQLVFRLARTVEAQEHPSHWDTWIILAISALLPMVRPEGIAVALGLLLLAGLLSPKYWKNRAIAAGAALAVFVAITLLRLIYFGQPVPNTFYAKVSSDALQGIVDGLRYLLSFVFGAPFIDVLLALWVAVLGWAVVALVQTRPGAKAMLISGAAVFGLLVVYAVLGGDHFVLWRFYQPVVPLLPVPLAIGLAVLLSDGQGKVQRLRAAGGFAALAAFGFVMGAGWLSYYQARFDIDKEFRLVERGVAFGTYLNEVSPRPSIGTGPAGGIALAYDGHIYDLLGLNWTEMAHANPVKRGMRNHASFDPGVFWAHAPDLFTTFNRPCNDGRTFRYWESNDDAFQDMFSDPKFRQDYRPVEFRDGAECWPGFAKPAWIAEAEATGISGLQVFDWQDVKVLN